MDAISVAHLSIKRNLRVNYGGVGEAYLRGIIVVASNAFVRTKCETTYFRFGGDGWFRACWDVSQSHKNAENSAATRLSPLIEI